MNLFNVAYETRHGGAFLITELPSYSSRAQGTMVNVTASDLIMPAGLVLASAAYLDATVTAMAGNVGNGVTSGLVFGPDAALGTYQVKFTSASAFTVVSPAAIALPSGTVGAAYATAFLSFTISAGGTPWAAGDTINIIAPPGDIGFVPWVNDGPATAILFNTNAVAAGATAARVAIVNRVAEVRASYLTYDPSVFGSTNPTFASLQAIAQQQLGEVGILARQ